MGICHKISTLGIHLLNNDGQVVMRLANFADDGIIYDQYYLEYFLHDAKTYFENITLEAIVPKGEFAGLKVHWAI